MTEFILQVSEWSKVTAVVLDIQADFDITLFRNQIYRTRQGRDEFNKTGLSSWQSRCHKTRSNILTLSRSQRTMPLHSFLFKTISIMVFLVSMYLDQFLANTPQSAPVQ